MSLKNSLIFIILLALLLSTSVGGAALSAHPERFKQVAQLLPGANALGFGHSVAISGDTVAMGDPYDNQYGEEAGAVTIFQSDGAGNWLEVARVTPLDAEAGIFFGRNLALSADRLVVGAPYDNDFGPQSGSVYIFERDQGGPNAWGQVAKLTASDPTRYDSYGWAVTVDGDTVVASNYVYPPGGQVYVYERDAGGAGQWGETAQLSPDPPWYGAAFGESLDLDGDLLAIGAYAGGDYAGYVYVFQRQPGTSQWQRLTRFRAADTYAYDYFGYSVALDGWTILAGAPGVNGLTGAAYIFSADPAQPDVWNEQARLDASDGAMGEYFGIELDISGDTAWIGAPWHADGTGAVFVYEQDQGGSNQWGEVESVVGNDTVAGDEFGYWTSIDGDLAVSGAPGHLPNGSAYIFDLNPTWRMHLPIVMR
jgi:FG-GAP repeat